jgi:hypothetical protein
LRVCVGKTDAGGSDRVLIERVGNSWRGAFAPTLIERVGNTEAPSHQRSSSALVRNVVALVQVSHALVQVSHALVWPDRGAQRALTIARTEV